MRSKLAILSAVPLLLGAGAPPKRAIPVETRPVEARELVVAIDATGSLETDERKLSAEVAGVVRELDFEEGDEVTPDKVLATIDPETYTLRARKAKAATERSEAQREEADHALARRKELRARNEGWVSEEEILQHASRLKEAQATAEESRLLWKLAEEDERRSRIRAPLPGRIERRAVVLGQFLQVGAPVATLVDPSLLRLRFKVTALEASCLEKGQSLSFRVREFPGTFQAGLFHVSSQADPATRTVECVARVDAPDARLRAGHFTEIRLEVGRKEKAITVPEAALLPTDRGYVAFVAEGRTARRRPVTLGLHTAGGEVEVLSGLAPGDLLVVRGAQLLSDGAAIEPRATAP